MQIKENPAILKAVIPKATLRVPLPLILFNDFSVKQK